jgi:predicted transcriptional regulator
MDEILLTDMAADGEMKEDIGGEQKPMNWKELVAQLKTMLANKEVTLGQIAGEMGWNPEEIAGEIDSNWLKEVTEAIETLGKVKEALGVTGEMDVVAVAKASAEAAAAKAKADHEAMVAEVLKEKVKGEMAQGLVMRMLQVPAGATKEQVAGEIDKLLADEKVKAAIDRLYTDAPLPKPGVGDPAPQNIKVIRAAI